MLSRRNFVVSALYPIMANLAVAKSFPDKYIKLVIPYSAGGPGDYLGRLFATEVAKELLGSIVVENKPGGGSIIGTNYAAASKNDGYTLIQVTSSQYINSLLYGKKNSYDLSQLFDPISYNFEMPLVLVTPAKKGIKTLAELLHYAKSNSLSYGSGSIGTIGHLTSELLKIKTGIDAINIPYTSNGNAMVDLLSGRLDFYFTTSVDAYARVKNGELNALAITTKKQDTNLPNTPTMQELGYQDIDSVVSWGYMVPKGTDINIIKTYQQAISKVLKGKVIKENLEKMGIILVDGDDKMLQQKIKDENLKWAEIVRNEKIEVK